MNSPLVHLCSSAEWETAQTVGAHRPASLDTEGFVHLSAPEQVHLPANRLFVGREDIVLLGLDPALLGAPVKWEPSTTTGEESMMFPHLYGPLPAAAVTSVTPYRAGPEGRFPPLTGPQSAGSDT